MNIVNEKKFIDVWRTDIDDKIFIKIVKSTSLTMNHVSCVFSIEKKSASFHLNFEFVSEDKYWLCSSVSVETDEDIRYDKNDLTEWMKIRALFNLRTKIVAKFLWKNIICCFECFESTVINEDFENKTVTEELLNRYRIRIKLTSTYHASINEMIEKEHRSLINVLSKLIENKIERWFQHFHAMLWTDRIIVRDFIDVISFRLLYEHDAILFIEIKYSIWHIMNWNKIRSIEDLLAMRVKQFQKRNEDFKKVILHLKRMREQNKELVDNKHQWQKIFLNADDLMLRHDIKFNNKHDFELVFRWNESFRIQRADSMKNIYILKKMNETCLEKTYADNRLKRFKTKNVKDSLTKRIEIYKMLNITPENSIDAIKKSNIVNKDVRVDDKIQNEIVRDIAESSDADSQIFENDVTNDNLSNSKIRNIHARIKFSTRRSNQLIEIENSLNNIEGSISTTAFATIDEVSIEKEWNAMKIEKFETYINDYNSENSWIASLIFRNRSFAINIFSKQSILSMNYVKKKNDDVIAIIENTNFDISAVVLDLSVLEIFDILSSSASFFFYMNHIKL